MICAKCGEPMRMTDKNTFTGRDIREYTCDACGYESWEDRGKALWQILSDDREEFEAAKAAREAAADPEAQGESQQSKVSPASSRWTRFISWLGGSRKGK
jgi:hypothetical protein